MLFKDLTLHLIFRIRFYISIRLKSSTFCVFMTSFGNVCPLYTEISILFSGLLSCRSVVCSKLLLFYSLTFFYCNHTWTTLFPKTTSVSILNHGMSNNWYDSIYPNYCNNSRLVLLYVNANSRNRILLYTFFNNITQPSKNYKRTINQLILNQT